MMSRATAFTSYDPAGRILSVENYWDTWSTTNGAYSSEAILANTCSYETAVPNPWYTAPSNPDRGLKLASSTYVRQTAGQPAWALERTDSYGYEPSLDYLTSANYGDTNANPNQSWTYDAAGNRNDAVTDNLNRASSVGGVSCNNDILGNRLTKGTNTFGWDALNRMTGYNSNSYEYRADGMRVGKIVGSTSTVYRHDGQMGMEDVDTAGSSTTVTDYAIGSRGIDSITVTTGTNTTVSYPLYDAHGNMVATLARGSQAGTYTFTPERIFDAWGVIRSANAAGDPKGRYCASLGHKQDDESGLVYMRARYYEPATGRFISEDSRRQGLNWSRYCGADPVNRADESGSWFLNIDDPDLFKLYTGLMFASIVGAMAFAYFDNLSKTVACLASAVLFAGLALGDTNVGQLFIFISSSPTIVATLVAIAASDEVMTKNPYLCGIGALFTMQLVMDVGALATIDPDTL